MSLVREERLSCPCGERLVVEYAPAERAPRLVELHCPRCARITRHELQFGAEVWLVRRVTDTPVLPRMPRLPDD